MKLPSRLVCAFVFLAMASGVFAASTPPPAQPPATPAPAPQQSPAPAPIPGLPVSSLKFDDYINALTTALKLSDEEKKGIADFYQADGLQLKNILNSDSISPIDQDRQVSTLRDARNTKIEALLVSDDRIDAFLKVEAKYRVALVELAADGGLEPPGQTDSAAPAPTPAPAPAAAPAAPVSAKTPPPM